MIDIDEAIRRVAEHCHPLHDVPMMLEQIAGHVLAQDINSDVDSPPFDKSMMDGFAIKASDVASGNGNLEVVGRILAGSRFDGSIESGQAVQIMTGAPIPDGADAVVMVEQTTEKNSHVMINADVVDGQNILPRATAMSKGQSVMQAGDFIRGEDIGLLAEAGAANCNVVPRPTLAVIATGDELIDVRQKPVDSQIRNSNGPMLTALAKPFCSDVINLGIGADNPGQLGTSINEGLHYDVLVLSGGVSAGVADLVPGLLQEAGVNQVFHKVKIKPGKPIWFGFLDHDPENKPGNRKTLVFGLPGNPVSSMVCFRVFVAPALLQLAGRDPAINSLTGKLTSSHSQRTGRTTYWPCRLTRSDDNVQVLPLDWRGSADLKTLKQANGFGVFPGDRAKFEPGETIRVFPME